MAESTGPEKAAPRGPSTAAVWLQQIRAPFLILAVVLVLMGGGAAWHDGYSHWPHFFLLMVGVILTHVSVNLFNELSDYKTGIDFQTTRTPFSGGSGMLTSGRTSYGAVRAAAYGALAAAALIGVYFSWKVGPPVLLFMLVGGLSIRFYTTHLARWLMGEAFAGLALGTLVVLGVYYCLAGRLSPAVVFVSIAPGILTSLLLFLNEFPDAEADKSGGRKHLVIMLGRKRSAVVYAACLGAVYAVIILSPLVVKAPWTVLLGLLTLPVAVKASAVALRHHDDLPKLVPALGMNVLVVLATDLLLAVGFFLGCRG